MTAVSEIKSFTVRLQPEIYEAAARVAKKRGSSLNALIQTGLEKIIRVEEERELYEAATLLGMDVAECDMEYALPAQAEVVLCIER